MSIFRVPGDFGPSSTQHNMLRLEGVTIIESCNQVHYDKLDVYLEDHLLMFVLNGEHHLKIGNEQVIVGKQEFILLRRNCYFESHKMDNPVDGAGFDSILFFLKDSLIVDFLQHVNFYPGEVRHIKEAKLVSHPFGNRILKFLQSLHPFFHEQEQISAELLKLKTIELLHHLRETNKDEFSRLMFFRKDFANDISKIINENYLKRISLKDLAGLSGRSLSSFRRDFFKLYQRPPARWLLEQRLIKAKELLGSTSITIGDLCKAVGFESLGHFSRAYKDYYGYSPSVERGPKQNKQQEKGG